MAIEHIILDLDHTIITSVTRKKSGSFRVHRFASYYIYERPFLREFLVWAAKRFTVSVWTAASEEYGLFIVKNIIEPYIGRPVDLFLHNYHCGVSAEMKNGIIKHLDMLHGFGEYGMPNFARKNTVIIDDNDGILAQNNYVIQVKKFEFDPRDVELRGVVEKIIALNKL